MFLVGSLQPLAAQDGQESLLEVFAVPGVSMYADSVGFGATVGAGSELESLFGLEGPFAQTMVGLSVRYDGLLAVDNYNVHSVGAVVSAGYRLHMARFFRQTPVVSLLRITPRLSTGVMYHKRERHERDAYSGAAYYLAPGLVVDMSVPSVPELRLGLAGEFNMLFSDMRINNVHIGPYVSWAL